MKGWQAMSFRIDRVVLNHLIVLLVSGKLTGEHVDTLRNILLQESGALAIDLENVSLVDRDAVQLLALAEYNGRELRSCPKYAREWINREMHEK
jgi:anti-anti-sigma regulatory factor